MPLTQHGLNEQGQPIWVRERFAPAFYTVPGDWIGKVRSDIRNPSVQELIYNDRGGPLDGLIVVREVLRDGKTFVVLTNNATIQFGIEIERDAPNISDAEMRPLFPAEAWVLAREFDAKQTPPIELMPEHIQIFYTDDKEKRVVIIRRDKDGSFGYEEQYFSVPDWERKLTNHPPDWKERYPMHWDRGWKLVDPKTINRFPTAEQAVAAARANVQWLV
jgi:hypothetical protein